MAKWLVTNGLYVACLEKVIWKVKQGWTRLVPGWVNA